MSELRLPTGLEGFILKFKNLNKIVKGRILHNMGPFNVKVSILCYQEPD